MSRLLVTLFCLAWLIPLPSNAQQQVGREPVVLIAHPSLPDPNFAQTVVLVVFPVSGGPTGVILNQPTRLQWKDAFPDQPALAKRTDPIFFGGPVRLTGLWYMLRTQSAPKSALPVLEDVYLSADGKFLDQLLADGGRVERFFVGYSGWSGPQLEMEIAQGAWYVLPADLEILELAPETMWRDLLLRATAVKT